LIAVCETSVVLPIATGGNFARARGFAVPLDGVGLKTRGIVRCDQPLAMDLSARRCH
jgi:mRNA-degrading endonuclease toxin of MazEF toxin-antitoxin module